MASWFEDKAAADPARQGDGGSEREQPNMEARSRSRATPDQRGLGPGWLRRHDDRDELEDRLADQRRQDAGWLVAPLTDEGYW